MNLDSAPKLSSTDWTASQIAAVVSRSLAWPADLADRVDPLRTSLEAVLAHDCRVLVERLNRVPELHLAAFVSVLPVAPVPPVSAAAPLSFKAVRARAATESPLVPRYTEVAAAADGSGAPVVFQTERDVQVLRADLTRALTVDMRRPLQGNAREWVPGGEQANATAIAPANATAPVSPALLVHALYIGQKALGEQPPLTGLQLSVDIGGAGTATGSAQIEWGMATPAGFMALTPVRDSTAGLAQSGEIAFGALPIWPQATVHGIENCWLSARLRSAPAKRAPADAIDTSASMPLAWPTVRALSLSTQHALAASPLDGAWYGRMPLDVSRDFFPFGEQPRFGDVFYVASKHFVFGGAQVELRIKLTNPADGDPDAVPIPLVSRDGEPRVLWDIQTPNGWTSLTATDQTASFTLDGTLTFTVPPDAALTAIGNVSSGWLRARLVSGGYGVARSTPDSMMLPAVAAPSIAQMTVSVSITRGPLQPEQVIVDDGLEQIEVSKTVDARLMPFRPFAASDPPGEALYLGIQAAPGELAEHTLSVYVSVAADDAPPVCRDPDTSVAAVRWQVRGASDWCDCAALDHTAGLRESGFVTLTIGADVAPWHGAVFDPQGALMWLRGVRENADFGRAVLPAIRHIALNAVPATESMRMQRELLGSSTGRPSMLFHSARHPLIGEVELEVREGPAGSAQEWRPWHCVASFDKSSPWSPDFVVDRHTGAVSFGDGRHGRIPPAGGNNLRISYATGGGVRGNVAASKITQLRTTIPYIESVTNVEAASGGQDAQDALASRAAALAWLRHRDRAVCVNDYAALALRAAPEVARAAALASADMNLDRPGVMQPAGVVGVSIVPRSTASEPQPSAALLRNVKRFLDARRPAGVELLLFGPSYLRVGVSATLSVERGAQAARVIAQCKDRLDSFLHPLSGGPKGLGWDFGARPHASDLHRVLDGIDGLVYVQAVHLRFDAASPDAPGAACYLVCAGSHALHAG